MNSEINTVLFPMDSYYISLHTFFHRILSYPVLDSHGHCTTPLKGWAHLLPGKGSLQHTSSWARTPCKPKSPHTPAAFAHVCRAFKSFPSLWYDLCFFSLPVDFHATSRHMCWNWPASSKTIWVERRKVWWWANRWQLSSKNKHISSGSYAENDQILMTWESEGWHFETQPPHNLLYYNAYSKVSYLFNKTQPEEPPQTLSPWEITEGIYYNIIYFLTKMKIKHSYWPNLIET